MAANPLDLLVIGGGITGAGVARDAALRGMSVGLVEKRDFGAGTSGRSSKIIHGGVRYLEYLQFGLVRESARERTILRRIAPHLVHPLPFLYPVWEGESFWKIRAGLLLFDLLASSPAGERSRRLDPAQTRSHLPGLRDPLKGAVIYPEYITDDARFTLANIRSAAAHGAHVANHAKVERLLVEGGRVVGAEVRDVAAGWTSERGPPEAGQAAAPHPSVEVRARVTVNASGPWVQEVLTASGLPVPKPIVPSKGIHLLFSWERLPLRAATFLRSASGRAGLAMPRGPWVYLGTSDTEYHGDLDRPLAEPTEIDELLALARECFPDAGLDPDDVLATWAGIRPLIREDGKSTRDTSRHDEVWISPPGLVTVAGGKLTTYRPMANRVLQAVADASGRALPGRDRTAREALFGAPLESPESFSERMDVALESRGVGRPTRRRLLELYGTEIERLLSYGGEDERWLEPLAPGCPALRGEVRHAIEEEMALTLDDILDRRLALLLFSPGRGEEAAAPAAAIAAKLLGWTRDREDREILRFRKLVRDHGPRGAAAAPSGSETAGRERR